MFYDLPDPIKFVEDIYNNLDKNGIWHLEQSYMPAMIRNFSYDTICHEHLEYYSLKSIKFILDRVGFKIIDLEFNDINGGSFALTVAKKNSSCSQLEEQSGHLFGLKPSSSSTSRQASHLQQNGSL